MRNPAVALTWEFWRRGGPYAAFTVACIVGGIGLMLFNFPTDRLGHALHGFHFVFYATTTPFIVFSVFIGVGDPQHRHLLPLSTTFQLGWTLANGAVMILLSFGLTTLFINVMCDFNGPFWRPALVAIVLFIWCCVVASNIRTENPIRTGAVLIAAALFAMLDVGWLTNRYELDPLDPNNTTPLSLSLIEFLTLILVGAAGIACGVRVTSRSRRGERPLTVVVWKSLYGLWYGSRTSERRHSTPEAAESWREWREKGLVLPVVATVAGLATILLCLTGAVNAGQAPGVIGGFSSMILMFSFLFGGYLGCCGTKFDVPPFKATRPLTDTQLADGILINVAKTVTLTCTVWAIAMASAVGAVVLVRGRSIPSHAGLLFGSEGLALAIAAFAGAFVVALVAGWSVCSVGASLFALRKNLMSAMFLIVFTMPIWNVILVLSLVPEQFQERVMLGIWWFSAIVALAGVLFVFTVALRVKRVSVKRCVYANAITLVTFVVFCCMIAYETKTSPLTEIAKQPLSGVMLLLVAMAPSFATVAAPVAIWWNRHR
jgi:hypothetical protein